MDFRKINWWDRGRKRARVCLISNWSTRNGVFVFDLPKSAAWKSTGWNAAATSLIGCRVDIISTVHVVTAATAANATAAVSNRFRLRFGRFHRMWRCLDFMFDLLDQQIWIGGIHAEVQIRRILLIVFRPWAIHFDFWFAKNVRMTAARWFQYTAWATIAAHSNIKRCWSHFLLLAAWILRREKKNVCKSEEKK